MILVTLIQNAYSVRTNAIHIVVGSCNLSFRTFGEEKYNYEIGIRLQFKLSMTKMFLVDTFVQR